METRSYSDDCWDGTKMEALAKAYNDAREQMWQLLADRIGEKWQIVEAKVNLIPAIETSCIELPI